MIQCQQCHQFCEKPENGRFCKSCIKARQRVANARTNEERASQRRRRDRLREKAGLLKDGRKF